MEPLEPPLNPPLGIPLCNRPSYLTMRIIYIFIGLSVSTVLSTIVYGVNLFTMPGMQRVVYAKSSQLQPVFVHCSLP